MDYNGLTVLASSAVDSDELGVGTFALKDNRDSKDYLVRRLADGNCWMVQNLDLELADFAGHNLDNTQDKNEVLTPENTDLQDSGRTYWDPSESTVAKMTANGASNFGEFLNKMTGTGAENAPVTNSEQFQSYDLAGGDHFWGTKCTASGTNVQIYGTCDYAATVGNNGTSVIPRSYSNMVTSDQSTDFDKATQFRYVATNWETGLTHAKGDAAQTVDANGYPTTGPTAWDASAGTETTATNAFVPTKKAASGDGYLANNGVAYRSEAEGSFYGTMYVGHYYNWYAATAESGDYSTTKTGDASICPAGWRLPVNGGTTTNFSWSKLLQGTYGVIRTGGDQTTATANPPQGTEFGPSADMHKLPLSIPFTGNYNWQSGNLNDRGTNGIFWSSTVSSAPNARGLYFYSTGVSPQLNHNKVSGFTIRCVNKGSNQETVVSTCANGSICYDGNGADSGTMTNVTVTADETILTAPTFVRSGYAFAGWTTSPTGYGIVYGPNETIDSSSYNGADKAGLQLYAKWIKSSGTMQDFTATRCSAMKEHEVIALTDNRDGNTYSVAKLKDDNCWMTSNLALNLADFAGENPAKGYLTTENTDLSASRTDLIEVASTGGGNSGVKRWDPKVGADEDSVSFYAVIGNNGYYGWYAATAGSGRKSMVSGIASDSSCPSGWKLPSSWENLFAVTYNISTANGNASLARTLPHSLELTGWANLSPSLYRYDYMTNGGYWTSSPYDNERARQLALSQGTISPIYYSKKNTTGLAVRCVQRDQSE